MAKFDKKHFDGEIFQKYQKMVPNVKENILIKSGVLKINNELASRLREGVGGNYLVEPLKGSLEGNVVNYDGKTDIQTRARRTYTQGKIVVGRADGREEKDFATDITGAEFLPQAEMAGEIEDYFQGVYNGILTSILKGIFNMTGTAGTEFVTKHTYKVSGDGLTKAGTLNRAITRASGSKAAQFAISIMHSDIAADLAELELLQYVPYNDANGIEKMLGIAKRNGRTVFIEDDVPVSAEGEYTTYVLGKEAIEYADCGAEVPVEMARNASKYGGITQIFARKRKLFAPKYISFTKKSMASDSPTNAELENGANWEIVNDGDASSKTFVNHKLIPFVRILSKSAESNVVEAAAAASEEPASGEPANDGE